MTHTKKSQTVAHRIEIYSKNNNGEAVDVIDVIYVCSDWCHRSYCEDIDLLYEGWNGAHSVPVDSGITKCANCSSVIVG